VRSSEMPTSLNAQLSSSAKMDATENDIPPSAPFRVSGFPTLKFKPAGSLDFIDYEGDRSLESLIEFVEAKAKNSLDQTGSASKAAHSPEATVQAPLEDQHGHDHDHDHDEL
jgi:protein disulfide-isomerase A1